MPRQDLNIVVLSGFISEVPVAREGKNNHFLTFDIASESGYRKQDGTQVTWTDYHPIVVKGNAQYIKGAKKALQKGYRVEIKGSLKHRIKKDATGKSIKYSSVIVDRQGSVQVTYRPSGVQSQVEHVVSNVEERVAPLPQPVIQARPVENPQLVSVSEDDYYFNFDGC